MERVHKSLLDNCMKNICNAKLKLKQNRNEETY